MSLQRMREGADRLRTIPLPTVLRAAGARPDRYDKARWRTPRGVISLTGMKFFNWTCGIGGGGAIDLVIHLYGLDFQNALAWLDERCADCSPGPAASSPPLAPSPKLPKPDPRNLSAVTRYLVEQRRLSPTLLQRLIRCGDLHADDHANAVFLLRDTHNSPVGAELRGTGPHPWQGMAPGSRKNLGYFSVRPTHIDAIILCESAIDAISCFQIQSHRWCISTAGARANPGWLPAIIRHRLPVYCGFDADPTGDATAAAMIERYPSIIRLCPPRHDWNDLLTSLS